MAIQVGSEVGRLRRVLVHRPGREIDRMAPRMMEELLFDDILFARDAREEHAAFCKILNKAGAETLYAGDLLAECLAEPEVREDIFRWIERQGAQPRSGIDSLRDLETNELAEALIVGIHRATAHEDAEHPMYDMAPVPNYFFQRDPQVVFGDRVMISSMATDARRRESLLARALFRHHPALAVENPRFIVGEDPASPHVPIGGDRPTVEGGDVVVANRETLLIGVSQRSNRWGVERLADYLRVESTSYRNLIVVDIPQQRSYMHLDTVFTLIDQGTGLGYLPVIEPGGPLSAQVFHVDLGTRELTFSRRKSLQSALSDVGVEIEIIPCGGEADVLDQEREQWTDGANAFAIAPGVILLYRRNRRTVDALSSAGYRVLEEEQVTFGAEDLVGKGKTVVTVVGHELSRARGGPRCMTMPLNRDAL